MVAVGAIAMSSELRSPFSLMAVRTASQRSVWVGVTPQRSGCRSPRAARVWSYAGCGTVLGGQLGGPLQGREVDLLGDPGRQLLRLGGVERQPQREEHVLQPHHARGRPDASAGCDAADSALG